MTNKSIDQRAYRLSAIDMLRGLAVVVMAIDHVRDYFMLAAQGDPMTNADISVELFVTRWVTHFCAPVFVLLVGISAGLMTTRKSQTELVEFLIKRGLWLIFVECFVITTALTFSPGVGGNVPMFMQVLWVIGAGMVLLAGAQLLGRRTCFVIGAVIITGHNLLDVFWPVSNLFEPNWPLWVALHSQMSVYAGPFAIHFVYPLLPWVGVMFLGFGVAGVFELPAARRNALLLSSGIVMTLAFIVLRAIDIYGEPNAWQSQASGLTATIIDFLNTTKYPPSLSFLLMTLGPAAVLCAFADRMSGVIKDTLVMFGRVPFAFYVAHFFLIHALSMLLGVIQGFNAYQFLTLPFFYPKGYGVSLTGVYVVWALVIVILYPFCRKVAAVKVRRRDWWLSYV